MTDRNPNSPEGRSTIIPKPQTAPARVSQAQRATHPQAPVETRLDHSEGLSPNDITYALKHCPNAVNRMRQEHPNLTDTEIAQELYQSNQVPNPRPTPTRRPSLLDALETSQ